jgi:hypothetical protein
MVSDVHACDMVIVSETTCGTGLGSALLEERGVRHNSVVFIIIVRAEPHIRCIVVLQYFFCPNLEGLSLPVGMFQVE